jgi:hypothetical protein
MHFGNSMLVLPRVDYFNIYCVGSGVSQRCLWRVLLPSGIWRLVVRWKFIDVSEERTAYIFRVEEYAKQITSKNQTALFTFVPYYLTLKMEAVRSSETAVNFFRIIRRHIPEDCALRIAQSLEGTLCYDLHFIDIILLYPCHILLRIWKVIEFAMKTGKQCIREHGFHNIFFSLFSSLYKVYYSSCAPSLYLLKRFSDTHKPASWRRLKSAYCSCLQIF